MERFRRSWSTPSRVEAGLSLAVAAVLVAVVVVHTGDDRRGPLAVLGVAALAILAVPGIAGTLPLAVGVAAATLGLAGAAASVPAMPLFAAGLFAVVELALWSAEDRARVLEEPGPRRERALLVGGVAAASVAVGAALVLLARGGERGAAATVVAAAAVVGLAGLIVGAASSTRAGGGPEARDATGAVSEPPSGTT